MISPLTFDDTRLGETMVGLQERLRGGFKSAMTRNDEPEKPFTPASRGSRARKLLAERQSNPSPLKATMSTHMKESLKIEKMHQQRRFYLSEAKRL